MPILRDDAPFGVIAHLLERTMAKESRREDARRLEEIRLEMEERLAPRYKHLKPSAFADMVAKMADARFRLEQSESGFQSIND
jgi:hypothetical protein